MANKTNCGLKKQTSRIWKTD